MEVMRTMAILLVLSVLLHSCKDEKTGPTPLSNTQEFHDYWHAGKAEISSYSLTQSRYGEPRAGKAVLIFVTEDLSKKSQVKVDDPSRRNRINVLKMNFTKKFITGIYPYSLMLSVFTPTNRFSEPASLKATMSSQEWCGQVYSQLNLRGNRYAVKSHSYFEEEGDEMFSLRQATLEDEIWNLIRLDHENLPQGEIEVIPGLFHSRLNHVSLERKDAIAEKSETDSTYAYSVRYPEDNRLLVIYFEKRFPFKISGWRETWDERGKTMETTATLDKTIFTDYWLRNKSEFLYLRDSLNLPTPY